MWGVIFNLATEGLGKYTATASGLFMTMVVGGGVMPFIQNLMATTIGDIQSYWLIVWHVRLHALLRFDWLTSFKEGLNRHLL